MPSPAPGLRPCSGIQTPSLAPPSFTRLRGLNASVDEGAGTFSVQLSADLDRPGQVFYALYRWVGGWLKWWMALRLVGEGGWQGGGPGVARQVPLAHAPSLPGGTASA